MQNRFTAGRNLIIVAVNGAAKVANLKLPVAVLCRCCPGLFISGTAQVDPDGYDRFFIKFNSGL
ncbi:hypothetical protein AB434_2100 [Heyndrickxia coagulans]|uniref:Uncharacterized protein n=1 Tax=Heyndrickxia coagulans TaxID=1398 RepID=A0AAN0T7N5_HEYCO|nr:hypothetical protein SB48_HM08orf05152 [Heyndrickxia coagulans]AKN54505.1 hypothetical protein AB434_2100 [Heyndrickxia coagulans]